MTSCQGPHLQTHEAHLQIGGQAEEKAAVGAKRKKTGEEANREIVTVGEKEVEVDLQVQEPKNTPVPKVDEDQDQDRKNISHLVTAEEPLLLPHRLKHRDRLLNRQLSERTKSTNTERRKVRRI